MTRYSFTGPSVLTPAEVAHAATVVAGLEASEQITTGAAAGWDMAVAFAAIRAWPEAHHQIICPGARYDKAGVLALVDLAVELGHRELTVIEMPPEITPLASYRRRNERLVEEGDVLVAAVRSSRFYRSGEWMTANIAKHADVPVRFVDLRRVPR